MTESNNTGSNIDNLKIGDIDLDNLDFNSLITEIGPNTYEIDTYLGGWNHVTAGYLLGGPRPFLVETGSQSSVKVLSKALSHLGIENGQLFGAAVTHIHLDHAGGIGDIAKAFKNAKIYVHPLGARHLIDPTKLISSASLVYGKLLDSLYGRLEPTEQQRITVLNDGDIIDLGNNRKLTAIDSPGHAKHHVALMDSESGLLFAGDAVGVRLPEAGILRPSSPPADFDLFKMINSLKKFNDAKPYRIALAHYGVVDTEPIELLSEAQEVVTRWAEVAKKAVIDHVDIAEALEEKFGLDFQKTDPSQKQKMETLNGIHSNAQGLKLWIEKNPDVLSMTSFNVKGILNTDLQGHSH